MSRPTPSGRHTARVFAWRGATCVLLGIWVCALPSGGARIQAAQAPAARSAGSSPSLAAQRAVFAKYCLTCHSAALKARGTVPVALDAIDLGNVRAHADTLEKVVLKMRAGLMPPAGAPRPDRATHDALAGWLETELDRAAAANPNPGRTEPIHRLNRTEYRNAIRDLLDLDVDVAALLPPDDASYGFDNIAGVLKVSPTLLERYLTAAQRIGRLAVGTPLPAPTIDFFRVTDDLPQDVHLPGMPFGTRGGSTVHYPFPMDAEYEIRVRLTRDLNESVPLYTEAQHVEISIDGERVGTFTLPGVGTAPPAPAGASPAAAPRPTPAPPPASPGSPGQAGQEPGQPQRPAISQITQTVRVTAREREARNREDEKWNLRVPVKAGQRNVTVTFTNRVSALDETARLPFLRPYPAGVNIPETRQGAFLRSIEIVGPLGQGAPGDSPTRRRIFSCHPSQSGGVTEDACAAAILASLTRRAYRRPVAAADVEPMMAFYREGRADGGFDAGIERALRRLLVSPEFLLRVERDPNSASRNAHYRINDVELASRLSFFLWSSIPDEELLTLAETRQLSQPATLERQVKRMMADARASAFIQNFAGQWLFLRNLQASVPVQSLFPDFDDTLRQSFQRETELFFESIVREDRSALDLLRADYTFLNERLAKHYGVPNVKGSHFRRVQLGKDNVRSGLLGQGSVLTVTSYPDRTSPVVRGKWILENLLGTPPPPPLPNVGDLKPTNGSGTVLSMRQRMEQHRANPVCASCHSMMDPLGLSLENFDAVGKWRTLGESSAPIDAAGVLPDGTKFTGPMGLRTALLGSNRFVATLTEKMLTYALGRGLEYYDAPAVRTILRDAAPADYRFSALVTGIVQSQPFRMRRVGAGL
jgi:mono/diheme cytochrome c family protein